MTTTLASPGSGPLSDADLRSVLDRAEPVPLHPRVARAEHRGRMFVVKHARRAGGGRDALRHEREAGERAAALRLPDGAALCTPPVWHDPDRLVFAAPEGRTTLQDLVAEGRGAEEARRCGAAAAALHGDDGRGLPPAVPERPRLFPLRVAEYATTSDQVIALLKQLDRHPAARDALASVSERHAPGAGSVFVHGDFKPDNILVSTGTDTGGTDGITVIDWELAGRGDPHEDLAAFLAGALSASLQARVHQVHQDRAADVRAAIEGAAGQSFGLLSAMLDGYRAVRPWSPDPERLLLLTGGRLLCRAQALATVGSQVGTVPTVLLRALAAMLGDLPRAVAGLRAALDEGGAR
ncbi:phosphotransferase [Nocardiopsis sp. RSe5-2]|uniref:Phosphotransferase n=1 Tax=Nocardiopsis endophytica TaxID=3018445 RepID=A0ABT4U6F7_9ACTN|nr:phosphotransferase [Nocardiopsis endophytica]MDA2812537.1 phosphotransferase [Nocardiopsis endophytica]